MTDHEIEAKFYVSQLAEIEKRVQKLDAHLIQRRTREINWRFDTPQGDLRREGRVLRLRSDQGIHLTYKDRGKNERGALSRREIEFSASDLEAARKFIEALGYVAIFTYEKYRTTYSFSPRANAISKTSKGRAVQLMLDELPYGNFVEIEGELDTLKPAAAELGIAWKAAIPASYHALFEHVCEARNLRFRDLTFENFKEIQILPIDLGINPADE